MTDARKLLRVGMILAAVLVAGCAPDNTAKLAEIEGKLDVLLAADAAAPQGSPERLGALTRRIQTLESKVDDLLTALEFLAIDIDGIKRNTWDMLQSIQTSGPEGEVPVPEEYQRLFSPEARAALVDLAAKKGVTLKDDRVEVPGVIIQTRAMLEFLVVVAGGKEHEAIVALIGNGEHGGEVPEGLAGMINACILALGFERGTPVRFRENKVLPAEGMRINVYFEWEGEDGETVRARGEDLVYNIEKKLPMARGKWVYVGSRFERAYQSDESVYMADLTGDIVATYSWPNTIIDNTTSEGSDDLYYTCYTPRIPKIGTKVKLVLSRVELPAKDFPEEKTTEEAPGDDGNDGD